jgi:hypothetical protein
MNHAEHATYPPLNTLKRVVENLWIVDGPIIRFGMPWPKMPFPTRMTVIRCRDGDLFIHSPTPLVPELRAEIETAGRPRWIIGPNRIHYWWIPEWRAAFRDADVYLAPTHQRAGRRSDRLRILRTRSRRRLSVGFGDCNAAGIEQMIVWNPARIILAHGRWYERDGTAELHRAFRWLLD